MKQENEGGKERGGEGRGGDIRDAAVDRRSWRIPPASVASSC